MISEGPHDTEDWSNDAEISALLHRNKSHFKIYSNKTPILNCNTSQYYDLLYFLSNKYSLDEHKRILKTFKNLSVLNF